MYDLHDIVLQLSGELDDPNTPAFDKCVDAAIDEHPRRLIVEMSALDSLDEAGLGAVVGARDRATSVDVDFVLDSPNALVTSMLDHAGIRESFFIR